MSQTNEIPLYAYKLPQIKIAVVGTKCSSRNYTLSVYAWVDEALRTVLVSSPEAE